MKFDIDCAREILLTLEAKEYDCSMSFVELNNSLPSFSSEPLTVQYHCLKLEEAGFITTERKHYGVNASNSIERITDITYAGHQFIESIRSDKVYSAVKSIGGKIGATTLNAFITIASNVITELIKNHFGF